VVAAVHRAEHRTGEIAVGRIRRVELDRLVRQELIVAGDGAPDDEAEGKIRVEEHATVAAIEREPELAVELRVVVERR